MNSQKIPINFGILGINIEDITSVVKQLNYNSEIRNLVDCTAKSILRRNILEDRKPRETREEYLYPFNIDRRRTNKALNKSQVHNQELSGAKSELSVGAVGVCSFHRRCGQLPYNLPITHLRFTPRSLQVCLLAHFNK